MKPAEKVVWLWGTSNKTWSSHRRLKLTRTFSRPSTSAAKRSRLAVGREKKSGLQESGWMGELQPLE